jgi:hypothetical protein
MLGNYFKDYAIHKNHPNMLHEKSKLQNCATQFYKYKILIYTENIR